MEPAGQGHAHRPIIALSAGQEAIHTYRSPRMSPEDVVFDESMEFTLRWEGGFSDHPDDPGGATNMGVTQKTYDAFRVGLGFFKRPVLEITHVERDNIYRFQYWKKAGCDEQAIFSPMIAMVQFDAAVNVGVSRSTKWLQGAVRANRDGIYGPLTHEAFSIRLDEIGEDEMADQLLTKREEWYIYLRDKPAPANFGVFYKGWTNRVNDLREELGVL